MRIKKLRRFGTLVSRSLFRYGFFMNNKRENVRRIDVNGVINFRRKTEEIIRWNSFSAVSFDCETNEAEPVLF